MATDTRTYRDHAGRVTKVRKATRSMHHGGWWYVYESDVMPSGRPYWHLIAGPFTKQEASEHLDWLDTHR